MDHRRRKIYCQLRSHLKESEFRFENINVMKDHIKEAHHYQGTLNKFFFYVEICFLKVTKFSDFF